MKLAAFLILLLVINLHAGDTGNITPDRAQALIRANKTATVLDVRTPEEYNAGHLRNSILINYYDPEFSKRVRLLPRAATIVVYCRSGRRSAEALELMRSMGFTHVYNVLGGIERWKKEKREVVL